MINPGLVRRSIRETWLTTLLFACSLGVFAGLLNYALPRFQARMGMGRGQAPPFLERLRSVILGVETAGMGVTEIAAGIAWSHPAVLALLWAHAIVFCTRVPAGEVEKGTIDVLLGLPISRWQLYLSETAVWLGSALVLLGAAVLGSRVGNSLIDPALRPDAWKLGVVQVNLLALYLAVGAGAWLGSSLVDRRGRAVLAVMIVVLGSFLLNYLALLWPEVERLNAASLLHYYRPVFVLRSGEWPWRNLAVLGGLAVGLWTAAGLVLARRDLSTT
ncbi:MAG: ABC transporter permease subunit [Phycisphaerales bacterium]